MRDCPVEKSGRRRTPKTRFLRGVRESITPTIEWLVEEREDIVTYV